MTRIQEKTEIVHPELSYKIVGLCFQDQKDLGRFCREKQYADRLEVLLQENGIPYKREIEIKSFIPASPKGNRVDFIIDDKIILDCKAKPFLTKDDYIQMQRYLISAHKQLGLIVNFRSHYLKPKRILNSEFLK